MDDDQQFCLRWNNHQSTLVAVFDTLLENGTLVDCTLAAEGKFLNAHKVVLSACSPYFESLLSRHFDKHPILILKDVKFQELKAMMDYMYRGEVNISQDQLGALLKAAESLQIKGLSDNRKGETERKPAPAPPPPKSPQPTSALPKVQGLTIEQRSREDSREGSMSPGPRKKKRLRRKSEELDNHDASNSSESHSLPAQNIPSSLPAVSKINADVPEPVETKSEILRHKQPDDIPQVPIIKEKIETHTELMLEPKSEYVEEMNEDSIEDLTLDDDDLSNMEQMDDQAGPSHGNAGEGSSQGFGGWHMGNQSQDEVFLAAQEAVGAHRDSQGDWKDIVKTEIEDENENESNSLDINLPSIVNTLDGQQSSLNLMPEKSKAKYDLAYKWFMDWQKENNKNMLLSEDVLMAYFKRISNKFKPTTLWTQYSMLRMTLNIYNNVDIEKYVSLRVFLKKLSNGYRPKKSKTLTAIQIERFIKEAPDKEYLLTKVALIMGVMGACRRHELYSMRTSNIEDLGSAAIITIPHAKTKEPRKFTITGYLYTIFKKYANLRPPHVNDSYFFVNYQKEKCTVQRVGINKFGYMGKQIANYLQLSNSELYTSHCFRRSSGSLLFL